MRKTDARIVYLALTAGEAFSTGMIFSYSSVYQVTIAGLNPLQLVLVGTTLECAAFLFEIPTGIIADVYSRRLSIIIGHFFIGLGFLVEGAFPYFATILIAQVLWGLGWTFTSGATQAWITDEVGETSAGRIFLRGAQAENIGALLGIFTGMALATIRVNIPILVGGGIFLLLSAALAIFMPETNFSPIPREDRNSWQQMVHTFQTGLHLTWRKPALFTILLIGLFFGLYSEGFDRLWTKLMIDTFTLPNLAVFGQIGWFGLLRAIAALLAFAATEWVNRQIDIQSYSIITRWLFALTTLLIISLFTFAWAGMLPLAFLAYLSISVLRSLIMPLYTTWVNQQLESGVRATVLSMSSQVDAIGQIGGGPLIGMIGNLVSIRAALTVSSLLLSPVLFLYRRVTRLHPQISHS